MALMLDHKRPTDPLAQRSGKRFSHQLAIVQQLGQLTNNDICKHVAELSLNICNPSLKSLGLDDVAVGSQDGTQPFSII